MFFLSYFIFYKCLVIILVLFIHNTKSSSNNRLLQFRNSFLRFYIATNNITKTKTNEYSKKIVEKTKKKKKFTNRIYEKIETKYRDFTIFYNSLSEEEKEIIDFIISLCY